MSEFSLSKLAAALKNVNDVGTEFLKQCMDKKPAADGKIAGDVEELRKAISDAFMCIGPRDDAKDVRTQEQARGDAQRASDSRHAGPSSPWAGTGDAPRGHYDTRFSLDNLLTSDGPGELTHSVDSVFKPTPKLAEG